MNKSLVGGENVRTNFDYRRRISLSGCVSREEEIQRGKHYEHRYPRSLPRQLSPTQSAVTSDS